MVVTMDTSSCIVNAATGYADSKKENQKNVSDFNYESIVKGVIPSMRGSIADDTAFGESLSANTKESSIAAIVEKNFGGRDLGMAPNLNKSPLLLNAGIEVHSVQFRSPTRGVKKVWNPAITPVSLKLPGKQLSPSSDQDVLRLDCSEDDLALIEKLSEGDDDILNISKEEENELLKSEDDEELVKIRHYLLESRGKRNLHCDLQQGSVKDIEDDLLKLSDDEGLLKSDSSDVDTDLEERLLRSDDDIGEIKDPCPNTGVEDEGTSAAVDVKESTETDEIVDEEIGGRVVTNDEELPLKDAGSESVEVQDDMLVHEEVSKVAKAKFVSEVEVLEGEFLEDEETVRLTEDGNMVFSEHSDDENDTDFPVDEEKIEEVVDDELEIVFVKTEEGSAAKLDTGIVNKPLHCALGRGGVEITVKLIDVQDISAENKGSAKMKQLARSHSVEALSQCVEKVSRNTGEVLEADDVGLQFIGENDIKIAMSSRSRHQSSESTAVNPVVHQPVEVEDATLKARCIGVDRTEQSYCQCIEHSGRNECREFASLKEGCTKNVQDVEIVGVLSVGQWEEEVLSSQSSEDVLVLQNNETVKFSHPLRVPVSQHVGTVTFSQHLENVRRSQHIDELPFSQHAEIVPVPQVLGVVPISQHVKVPVTRHVEEFTIPQNDEVSVPQNVVNSVPRNVKSSVPQNVNQVSVFLNVEAPSPQNVVELLVSQHIEAPVSQSVEVPVTQSVGVPVSRNLEEVPALQSIAVVGSQRVEVVGSQLNDVPISQLLEQAVSERTKVVSSQRQERNVVPQLATRTRTGSQSSPPMSQVCEDLALQRVEGAPASQGVKEFPTLQRAVVRISRRAGNLFTRRDGHCRQSLNDSSAAKDHQRPPLLPNRIPPLLQTTSPLHTPEPSATFSRNDGTYHQGPIVSNRWGNQLSSYNHHVSGNLGANIDFTADMSTDFIAWDYQHCLPSYWNHIPHAPTDSSPMFFPNATSAMGFDSGYAADSTIHFRGAEAIPALLADETSMDSKPGAFTNTNSRPYDNFKEDEIQDNNDPRWEEIRGLRTDAERYASLKKRWGNATMPNPRKNLTTHNFLLKNRARNPQVAVEARTPIFTNGRKRRASSGLVGERPGKRLCSILDEKFADVERKTNQHIERLKGQCLFQIKQVEQEREAAIANFINAYGYNFLNGDYFTELECDASRRKNEINNFFGREIDGVLKQKAKATNELKSAVDEMEAFYKFYGDDSNVHLTREEVEIFVEQERMFSVYDKFYDS